MMDFLLCVGGSFFMFLQGTERQINVDIINGLSKVKHSFAKHFIRYSLPNLINQSPICITGKLFIHSLKGFI